MKEVDEKVFNEDMLVEPFGVLNSCLMYKNEILDESKIDNSLEMELNVFPTMALAQSKKEFKEKKQNFKVYLPLNEMGKGYSKMPSGPVDGMTKSIYDHAKDLSDNLSDTIEKHGNNGIGRSAKVFKNQIDLATNENSVEINRLYPMLKGIYDTVTTSLPESYFKTGEDPNTKEPIYERDIEKHNQLMEKYGFLEMLEKAQKFIKEETIPYIEAKKKGTLTAEQVQAYNQKYLAHLQDVKASAEKVKTIDINDPLVKDNRTFINNPKMDELRWRKPADSIIDKVNSISSISNGWPVKDQGLLLEIKSWYESFGVEAKDQSRNPQQVQRAKNALKDKGMKKAYDALFSTKINSEATRKKLLSNFKPFITKYKDPNADVLPLDIAIGDAINSNTLKVEVGTAPVKMNEQPDNIINVNSINSINDGDDEIEYDEAVFEPEKSSILKKFDDLKKKDFDEKDIETEFNKNSISDDAGRYEGKDYDNDDKFIMAAERQSVKIDNKELRKEVKDLYESLNDVDYFMFGKSSTEFNEMMKSMKDLKEHVNQITSLGRNPKCSEVEVMDRLISDAKGKILDYLDHKQEDFNKDKLRRNRKDSQKREQPRIKAAINLYEKLSDLQDRSRDEVEKVIAPKAKSYLRNNIFKEYEDRRNITDVKEYKESLIKTLDSLHNYKMGCKMIENDDVENYIDRLSKMAHKNYTERMCDNIYKNNKMIKNLVDKILPPKSDKIPDKNPTAKDLDTLLTDEVKSMLRKDPNMRRQFRDMFLPKKNKSDMAGYKKSLYSKQTKNAMHNKIAGKGMGK